jgi:nitroreductase
MKLNRRELLAFAGVVAADPLASTGAATPEEPDSLLAWFAKRQTVRRYRPDTVPKEHLIKILDAARRGPTCMNQQPWKFLVVQDPKRIEAMKRRTLELMVAQFEQFAARNKEMKAADLASRKAKSIQFTEGYFTAPVYVVVLVDSESQCSGYALKHDGPIAVAYLMLAARTFGYGTAYLTDGIPEQVTREVLAIPARYTRICVTPIGIPDRWPEPTRKRQLDEMVAYETLEGHPPLAPVPYNP